MLKMPERLEKLKRLEAERYYLSSLVSFFGLSGLLL